MSERPPGMPDNTPDYMAPAWVGCLHWAIGEPDVVAAYRAETGDKWEPGRMPLDRMIDKATGRDRRFIKDFIAWFNVNVWGDPFAEDEPG